MSKQPRQMTFNEWLDREFAAKEAACLLAGSGCWDCDLGEQPVEHDASVRCIEDFVWHAPDFWCRLWCSMADSSRRRRA